MNAIIFGANGQDGSYLSELLLEKGYEVTGVTRRVSVNTNERIKHLLSNPKFHLVEGDISDYSSVDQILDDKLYHEIYNLAAQSHVGTSFKQPFVTTDIDYIGPLNILEWMRKANSDARFYQASTSEMFGDNFTEVQHSNKQLSLTSKIVERFQDEHTRFSPRSPYAVAKLGAHHLVNIYRDAYGLHASSGILFNHESPRRGELFVTRKITKWLGEFTKWHNPICDKAGFAKLRLGNIHAYRDWGHARDYVEAMYLMLQQDKPDDYVIATGETHSVEDFLVEAFKVINIGDYRPYIVIDPEFYRPAEVEYLLGSADKARRVLGWSPKTDFKTLVREMVEADGTKCP